MRCRRTFLFSSQESLDQFQPDLAQSIFASFFGPKGFKFVQMKGQVLLQGEIIKKYEKKKCTFKEYSFIEPFGQEGERRSL